jgi:hypothetical protein
MTLCIAETLNGYACKNKAKHNSAFCPVHSKMYRLNPVNWGEGRIASPYVYKNSYPLSKWK